MGRVERVAVVATALASAEAPGAVRACIVRIRRRCLGGLAAGMLLVVAGSIAGCVHRPVRTALGPAPLPDRYSRDVVGSPAPERWWTSFGDAALADWVERVLSNNVSLARAWARVEQARQAARIAGADELPSLTLEGLARRSRSATVISGRETPAATFNFFSLNAAASYELDVWGRVAAQVRAAQAEWTASRYDAAAAAISLAAETAEAWWALREQEVLLRLLRRQMEVSEEYRQLVELRFGAGLAGALDVFQQRQQTATVASLIPPVEARAEALRNQLALLAGEPPGAVRPRPPAAADLPAPPPPPLTGLPADLLRQRPDVAAAYERLTAADDRWAAAVANRLPTLRLTGGAGTQARELSGLFDEILWNVAAGLTAPLLDGGRREAEAERARAACDEAWHAWRQAILQAVREVEDALAAEERMRELAQRLDEQRAAAAATLNEARESYRHGLTDYLAVLSALDRLQQTERARVSARRQWLSARVQLHRALGGGWGGAANSSSE